MRWLVHKDPREMFNRAKNQIPEKTVTKNNTAENLINKGPLVPELLFFQFHEWISHDIRKTLQPTYFKH